MLPLILDRINGTSKVVTDMGSTKAGLPGYPQVIPAGAAMLPFIQWQVRSSRVPSAIGRLFDYKNAIICDPELSDKDALALVEKMLDILNMRKVYMNSSDHDVHVAYVSHISHITSFSLALVYSTRSRKNRTY